MDRVIYLAATGARAAAHRQEVVAGNLANLTTQGFKAQIAAYRTAPGVGPGMPTRAYTVETTVSPDFSGGPMLTTGNPADVAVHGKGWLAVQTQDGKEAYVRTGTLVPNANGELTLGGRLVQADGGGSLTLPPDQAIKVGSDGTLTATPMAGARNIPAVVGRLKLVNPPEASLVRGDDGLFRTRDGQPAPADPAVRVAPGMVEGSNTNPTETLVQMIAVQRQFETQMRMVQTAQENARSAAQLLGPGSAS